MIDHGAGFDGRIARFIDILHADRDAAGQPDLEIAETVATERLAEPVDGGNRHIGRLGDLALPHEGRAVQVELDEVGDALLAPLEIDLALAAIRATLPQLYELALGGTAVGTGLNAPPGFAVRCIELLSSELGLELHPEKTKRVDCLYVPPGRSTALGNAGWFGASG